LGPLPENHKALQLGQKIRQLLIVPHKESDLTAGTVTTSLWSCYWAFSWPAILLGGFLKFTGDLVGYVAPLGIQVLVTYINYHSDPASSESGSSGSFYYPSVEEFISNGYIMTAIVFLSSFLQVFVIFKNTLVNGSNLYYVIGSAVSIIQSCSMRRRNQIKDSFAVFCLRQNSPAFFIE